MRAALVYPKIAVFMALLVVSLPVCFAAEMNLTYDANGNLVTGDGQYRTYNTLNQLWKVYNGSSTSGTLLYEYTYHPVEERVLVKKMYNQSGGWVETDYYWSKNFVTVQNSSGYYNFTYVYHDGELVAQKDQSGAKLYFANDIKGSSYATIDASSVKIERTLYSPTGEILTGGRLGRYGYEAKEQEQGFGDVPTNGLVSYFALENDAVDGAFANNGIVTNAVRTTGQVRDGFAFDGYGDYIKFYDSSTLDLTSSVTISAWVNPAKASQGYIVAKYGAYMMQYSGSPSNYTQGGIWNSSSWNALATSSAIPLNTWTHVVFTYNKSNSYIYINGVLSGSTASTKAIDTNNQNLFIGAKNNTDRTRDFNGSIDEVGIWNRALSAQEVKALYDYGGQFNSGVRDVDFNARRMDPRLGIFVVPDKGIPDLYNPQSINHYMLELGNPYSHTDPNGLWAVQVGGSGQGTMGLVHAQGSAGFALSYDKDYGWEIGSSESVGLNAGWGLEGGLGGAISYTPNAKKLSDLKGSTLNWGGGVGILGYEHGFSKDPNLDSHTINFGLGGGYEAHMGVSETYVQPWIHIGGQQGTTYIQYNPVGNVVQLANGKYVASGSSDDDGSRKDGGDSSGGGSPQQIPNNSGGNYADLGAGTDPSNWD